MRKVYAVALLFLMCKAVSAQITITPADMPVAGDTLRYSIDLTSTTTINLSTTGPNSNWNYSSLVSDAQGIDSYKTAFAVNPLYAVTIAPTAYGYKFADTLGGGGSPVTLTNVYYFFSKKNSPPRYVAEAFAAVIGGIPTPVNYSDEAEWYFFPLTYPKRDSTTFKLSFALQPLGSMKMTGYRIDSVDGFGTIVTPYFPSGVQCIRVRAEIHEVDSIGFGAGPAIGFPRNTVEYKWLANGEHYPVLWVTASLLGSTETVTNIRYRDVYKQDTAGKVVDITPSYQVLKTYPNPTSGLVKITVPENWKNYVVEVFDVQARLVTTVANKNELDISALPQGRYGIRVISGTKTGYAIIVK
jgi:hypothetical protein